jgi:hypothetical protein
MSSHAADVLHSAALDNEATLDPGVPTRWIVLFAVAFVIGGALFGVGISTGKMWWLAPATLFGPGMLILGFTYLGITADTNRFS